MQTAILKIENINKKQIFWYLIFIAGLFATLYIYFIAQTTLNIVGYQSLEQKIITADSGISGLELEYITLKNEIDFEMASSLGYIEASNVKFIDKSVIGKSLSLVN